MDYKKVILAFFHTVWFLYRGQCYQCMAKLTYAEVDDFVAKAERAADIHGMPLFIFVDYDDGGIVAEPVTPYVGGSGFVAGIVGKGYTVDRDRIISHAYEHQI